MIVQSVIPESDFGESRREDCWSQASFRIEVFLNLQVVQTIFPLRPATHGSSVVNRAAFDYRGTLRKLFRQFWSEARLVGIYCERMDPFFT